jgi:transposase
MVALGREGGEVIPVSQWAEIRRMGLVDGMPRREIARRLAVDVKTVRRALRQETAPLKRLSPARGRRLDEHREQIVELLQMEPRITAKRIGRLIGASAIPVGERTLRDFVAALRARVHAREAFVHRTHAPGETMEVDFGHSMARITGKLMRVVFLVATLPACNAYFAKAYLAERLECLLDGILAAFTWFGGLSRRVVLDNTSLAVKHVLRGRDRVEQEAFHGFRGALPLHVDFCAPRRGNEKGSVEGGVDYVRDNCFRPIPDVAALDELNSAIVRELEEDLARRRLADGRTARDAWIAEKEHLRPLPAHLPEPCRVVSAVADKFGHVRLDRNTYSVPTDHAYRPVIAKLFCDRVVLAVEGEVVATAVRSFGEGQYVLDPMHVLPLLEKKHRAVDEATALKGWQLPAVFHELRARLRTLTRKPDQEWISVLRLLEEHAQERVAAATEQALQRGSPRLETIRLLLRQEEGALSPVAPVAVAREDLAALTVLPARLDSYDQLCAEAAR